MDVSASVSLITSCIYVLTTGSLHTTTRLKLCRTPIQLALDRITYTMVISLPPNAQVYHVDRAS